MYMAGQLHGEIVSRSNIPADKYTDNQERPADGLGDSRQPEQSPGFTLRKGPEPFIFFQHGVYHRLPVEKYADNYREIGHFPKREADNDAFFLVGQAVQDPGKCHDKYQRPSRQRNAGRGLRAENSINLRQNRKRTDDSNDKRKLIQENNVGGLPLFFESLPALIFMA